MWRGLRLAFFPVGMQATAPATPPGTPPAPEVVTPTYFAGGIFILVALMVVYFILGYALYTHHYTTFRLLAGAHIVLSVLTFSYGWLFLPSSLLLLLALLLSIGVSQTTQMQQAAKPNTSSG